VTYALGIKAHNVTGKPIRFDLFVYPGPNLEHRVAEGSVTEPGTSSAALTVGAACWLDNRLEDYSSQGPTIDARTKPDLIGPDSSPRSATARSRGAAPAGSRARPRPRLMSRPQPLS
jgi:hypothetical protein